MEETEPDVGDAGPLDYVTLAVFWGLATVVFLQFFTRYVLNDSLAWTEEIARYLLIAVTFLGAASAVRRRSHIAVELFHRYAPGGTLRWLLSLIDLISLAFFALLAWRCVELAQRTRQMMVSIDVPKAWLYWGVAGACALMAVFALVAFVQRLRGRVRDDGHRPLTD
jgi:TRAP-type C4-dicarboxylate transport system permease small subunit